MPRRSHGTMASWINQCFSFPWIEDSQVASKTNLKLALFNKLHKGAIWLYALDNLKYKIPRFYSWANLTIFDGQIICTLK